MRKRCPHTHRLLLHEPRVASDSPTPGAVACHYRTPTSRDALTGFGRRTIRFDIHFLIFQTAPQPLDENVVQKSSFAVHADPHALARKLVHERGAGKLHALIGVE